MSGVALTFEVGPLTIALRDVPGDLAAAWTRRWGSFTSTAGIAAATLVVDLEIGDGEPFIPRTQPGAPLDARVALEDAGTVAYLSYAARGSFHPEAGLGSLRLIRTGVEPLERALENFLRAACSWLAISRHGIVVHAASLVLDRRGLLFYGPSGAGKSTLCSFAECAEVLGDDISLVWREPGAEARMFGTPFRGSWAGPWVVGSWPLVSAFRLVKAPAARRVAVPRAAALAGLAAVLPFLGPAYSRYPVLERLDEIFGGVELCDLEFRKDATFWDALSGESRA